MLQQDVNSLEELEEIKRLKAEAAAEKARNNPLDCVSYNFLADIDFLFDL